MKQRALYHFAPSMTGSSNLCLCSARTSVSKLSQSPMRNSTASFASLPNISATRVCAHRTLMVNEMAWSTESCWEGPGRKGSPSTYKGAAAGASSPRPSWTPAWTASLSASPPPVWFAPTSALPSPPGWSRPPCTYRCLVSWTVTSCPRAPRPRPAGCCQSHRHKGPSQDCPPFKIRAVSSCSYNIRCSCGVVCDPSSSTTV